MRSNYNYCTLFNYTYLPQGISLIQSILDKSIGDSRVFVLSLDNEVATVLQDYFPVSNVEIIELSSIEDQSLLAVKKVRSVAEYCWTLTPFLVDFCLKEFQLDSCVYVDADCYFFDNPNLLYEKFLKSGSVVLTKHNFYYNSLDISIIILSLYLS